MAFRDAYQQARSAATPSGPWTDHVHVPVGAGIAALLRNSRVTPNQVSIAATACVLLGVTALVAMPNSVWGPGLFVGAAYFGYTLDGADGILARISGRASLFGAWLDLSLDRFVHMCVLAGFTARQILIDPRMSTTIASLLLLWITSATAAYSASLLEQQSKIALLKGGTEPVSPGAESRPSRNVIRAIAVPVDFGFLMIALGFGALLGATGPVAIALALMNVLMIAFLTVRARRRFVAVPTTR